MKYLSFILALTVLVLSTTSSFMEDKCLDETLQTTNNQDQNDDGCSTECCSPFFSCKTCVGFVVKSFIVLIEYIPNQQKKIETMPTQSISDFPYSIWQPPKFA